MRSGLMHRTVPDEQEVLEKLARVPLFSAVGRTQLKNLAKSGKRIRFSPGQTVVKEGEQGIGFYLVLSGELAAQREGRQVGTLGNGAFFGEMALFDDQPRTADVVATAATECFVFTPWEFWSTCAQEPQVLRQLLQETVRRLRGRGPPLTD